jgi:hypothetical protein
MVPSATVIMALAAIAAFKKLSFLNFMASFLRVDMDSRALAIIELSIISSGGSV